MKLDTKVREKTTKKNLHFKIPARKALGQNLGSSMLAVSSCCLVVRVLGRCGFTILDVWFYFGIGAAVNYKITDVCLLGNMNRFFSVLRLCHICTHETL